jgi:serine/threonine-protein kinase
MRRFLRFTVEHCIDGRGEELKEYLIGVEVFDRRASYDPRLDPIVRVEARRLRSKLKQYYEGDGHDDDIVIELPKGSYVPAFRERRTPQQRARPEPQSNAIAVLPFGNLGGVADGDYFADGLTEELIHGLTRVPGLRVVAWNSAAQLRDRQHDLAAIGERLKVGAAVTGSVRRAGERLRVGVQLIEMASGVYLWSESYDRELRDVFALQDEIARAIVSALRLQLAGRMAPTASSSASPEVHNLYLQGRYHWNKRSREGLSRSVQLFERCVEIDPGFAPGHAALAGALCLLADYSLAHPRQVMPKAKAAALRAIELDSTLGEAWASLAIIRSLHDWEWEEAGRDYLRAFEFNPGSATGRHWYGVDYLAMHGRFEEAFQEVETARQLDPLSAIIVEGKGYIRMLQGQCEQAVRHYHEALDLDPFFFKAFSSIGRAYIQQEMYEEAIEMLQRAFALAPAIPQVLSALGQAQALAGNRAEALRILGELETMAGERHVNAMSFAIVHLGLGDKDRALDYLEVACAERETPLAAIGVHPVYDSLRHEGRFQAVLRRVGIRVRAGN